MARSKEESISQDDVLVACVRKLGGTDIEFGERGVVDFMLRGIPGFARQKDGGALRGSVWIDLEVPEDDMDAAFGLVEDYDALASGRLDAFPPEDLKGDVGAIRLLFERHFDPELISDNDPLGADAEAVWADWWGVDAPAPTGLGKLTAVDVSTKPPVNAWLLMGSRSSYPTVDEIGAARHDAARGIYEDTWTAPKQTEPGDLLFFYFMSPDKAVHFVARSAGHAFFAEAEDTGATWSRRQWWTHITPMVEIEPIPLAELLEVTGGTVMRSRAGKYLKPDAADALARLAQVKRPEDEPLLRQVLQPVSGPDFLPRPEGMTFEQWRQLNAGLFRLEADVEEFVVEPLLRFTLAEGESAGVAPQFRCGRGAVDYAVVADGTATCVVEVKLRVRRSPDSPWSSCKDFSQTMGYAERAGANAMLVDAFDIHLMRDGDTAPWRSFRREAMLDDDLAAIGRHLRGE